MHRIFHAPAPVAGLLLLAGCAGPLPGDPANAGNHPANADAAAAPMPPRSATLRPDPANSLPAFVTGAAPSPAHDHAGPGEHGAMAPLPADSDSDAAKGGHAGHGGGDPMGMDAMPGLSHGGAAPAPAEAAPDEPAPAPAPAAEGAWTCPMHPDVHAEEPGRCPVCGMRLVEREGGAQ